MNCDQAFDFLTDSSQRDSEALARHLAGCPRCRQLKETLEPALGLFDDLVPEPAIGSFERTVSAAGQDAVRIAEQSAARLSGRGPWSASRLHSAGRYAAVFLVGAALAFGVTATQDDLGDASPPVHSICPWQNKTEKAGSGDVQASAIIQSCVDCHTPPSSPADDTSAFNFDVLRRSFLLALQSRDWITATHSLQADRLSTSAT